MGSVKESQLLVLLLFLRAKMVPVPIEILSNPMASAAAA
jgi:hypothetical protein